MTEPLVGQTETAAKRSIWGHPRHKNGCDEKECWGCHPDYLKNFLGYFNHTEADHTPECKVKFLNSDLDVFQCEGCSDSHIARSKYWKTLDAAIASGRVKEVKDDLPVFPKRDFKYPKEAGGDFDFVFAPEDVLGTPLPNREGWFARGNVHVIGGSSGAGKTSLMIPALEAQARGERFLRHETFKLPYLILLVDRGGGAMNRTLKRLGCDSRVRENIVGLDCKDNQAAISRILQAIEARLIRPAVVFIEGGDYMVADTNKGGDVAAFMGALGRIAEHYHLAIILSVGAPKLKKGEEFKSKRDALIGSEKWSRSADSILIMEEEDDGTRRLTVKTRNGEPERFAFTMQHGRLSEVAVDTTAAPESALLSWAKVQHELAKTDESRRFWTRKAAEDGTSLPKSTLWRQLEEAREKGWIKLKPGPGKPPEYTYSGPERWPLGSRSLRSSLPGMR